MRTLRFLLGIALGVALILAAVAYISRSRIELRASDPRCHLLAIRVLGRTNDCLYLGNQLEGWARDFLRRRTQLKIKPLGVALTPFNQGPLANIAPSGADGRCTLAIWFRLDQPPGALPSFRGELFDKAGRAVPAGGGSPT
jgi:hypothetical protein